MEPRLWKWIRPAAFLVVLASGAALTVWLQNRPPAPPPKFLPMPKILQRSQYTFVGPPPVLDASSTEDQVPGAKPDETDAAPSLVSSPLPAAEPTEDWQQHFPTPPPALTPRPASAADDFPAPSPAMPSLSPSAVGTGEADGGTEPTAGSGSDDSPDGPKPSTP